MTTHSHHDDEPSSNRIGQYPIHVEGLMERSPPLHAYVADQCAQRSIEFISEETSQKLLKLKNQSDPDYEFPKELKFETQPKLGQSKMAYRNLINSYPCGFSFAECMEQRKKYTGRDHRDPGHHPLAQFDYDDVTKEWMN